MLEKNGKVKTNLFGYSKKQIHTVLADLSGELEKKIKEKDAEIDDLKKQNKTLLEENGSLYAKVNELQKEKDVISQAILSAQKEAQQIVAEAKAEAEKIGGALNQEMAEQKRLLAAAQAEVAQHKRAVLAVMEQYKSQLDLLEGKPLKGTEK